MYIDEYLYTGFLIDGEKCYLFHLEYEDYSDIIVAVSLTIL